MTNSDRLGQIGSAALVSAAGGPAGSWLVLTPSAGRMSQLPCWPGPPPTSTTAPSALLPPGDLLRRRPIPQLCVPSCPPKRGQEDSSCMSAPETVHLCLGLTEALHFAPGEGEGRCGLLPLAGWPAGRRVLAAKVGTVGSRTRGPSPPLLKGKGLQGTSALTQSPGLGPRALQVTGCLGDAGRGLGSLLRFSLFFFKRGCLVSPARPSCRRPS